MAQAELERVLEEMRHGGIRPVPYATRPWPWRFARLAVSTLMALIAVLGGVALGGAGAPPPPRR